MIGAAPAAPVVYTDGSCLGNPGRGGWAWAVPGGPFASGAEPRTTNQRMEITAVLEALRTLMGPGQADRGRERLDLRRQLLPRPLVGGLAAPGLEEHADKPVANRDLWEPLVELVLDARAPTVGFRWVKGHCGDQWNDLVDALALDGGHDGGGPPRAG